MVKYILLALVGGMILFLVITSGCASKLRQVPDGKCDRFRSCGEDMPQYCADFCSSFRMTTEDVW